MCGELVSVSNTQANRIPAVYGQKESLVLRLWKNDSLLFWGSQGIFADPWIFMENWHDSGLEAEAVKIQGR